MRPGQSLSSLTARILTGLEAYFEASRPDVVLGHGDTTTCFATALSSFYHQIPFLHVEAGLRTHRIDSPFPEEFNRQNVASLASHHFAPTEVERQNLINEGISDSSISIIGSTIHEAVDLMKSSLSNNETLPFRLPMDKKIVTVTLHRREGLNSLDQTLEGVRLTAKERPDTVFICPVHPNPNVQAAFRGCLSGLENVHLVDPLSYPDFIRLLLRTDLVLTDSGGVQEEGSFLGKRILIARSETERRDGMNEGLVSIIGTSRDQIYSQLTQHLETSRPAATEIIAEYIEQMAL